MVIAPDDDEHDHHITTIHLNLVFIEKDTTLLELEELSSTKVYVVLIDHSHILISLSDLITQLDSS